MLGLWIVRGGSDGPADLLLARVDRDLFVLAFSTAARAATCRDALGAQGQLFYVCRANMGAVISTARAAGAQGFIVDYDAAAVRFTAAHPLPVAGSPLP